MRAAIWFLLLFSTGLITTWLLKQNSAMVSLFLSQYRIDFSLNLLFIILIFLSALLWLCFYFIKVLKQWFWGTTILRIHSNQLAAHKALVKALHLYAINDLPNAQIATQKGLGHLQPNRFIKRLKPHSEDSPEVHQLRAALTWLQHQCNEKNNHPF